MTKRNRAKALADPTGLKPFDSGGGKSTKQDSKKAAEKIVQVIIETPKGSRNKYAFDPDRRVFKLKRVLPAGMAFPYDFGFVPSTRADDGDPVDVLVLMDEPAFPGCLLECRLIGIIQGEQEKQEANKKPKVERNDRVVAIEQRNHSFADIEHIDDLGHQFVRELEDFFTNYHDLNGEKYRVLGVHGPGQARKYIKQGIKKN
jgi:inorganic pyrophosphatase